MLCIVLVEICCSSNGHYYMFFVFFINCFFLCLLSGLGPYIRQGLYFLGGFRGGKCRYIKYHLKSHWKPLKAGFLNQVHGRWCARRGCFILFHRLRLPDDPGNEQSRITAFVAPGNGYPGSLISTPP